MYANKKEIVENFPNPGTDVSQVINRHDSTYTCLPVRERKGLAKNSELTLRKADTDTNLIRFFIAYGFPKQ